MSESRQRVLDAVEHRQPDRMAVDFGATRATGLHCSLVEQLRDAFGLRKQLVKIHEPYQMLGYIDEDLREALRVDAVGVLPAGTNYGNPITGEWKEWRTPWKQTVLIPKTMMVRDNEDGSAVTFPQGDMSAPPSAKLPASGYFFDAIERQGEYDEDNPDPRDNTEEFKPISDDVLARLADEAARARATDKAVVAALPGTALGSASALPAMSLKRPKGIRSLADWYMALAALPDFVKEVFAIQTEIALENLQKVYNAVGDNYDVVLVCGADFGTQISTMISKDTFDSLFVPFYTRINGWIHQNTNWKTFKHCCGAVEPLIDSLIRAGFDILNPVQCSASGMDPQTLKDKYGDRITFWGGGIDTQRILPFGTPEEVRAQVIERCDIFSRGGGFVFNTVHNVQARTPLPNLLAVFAAVEEFNRAGR